MSKITIDTYSDKGVFVAVVERPGEDPIILEAEGLVATREKMKKVARRFNPTRYCICRLVPVEGNTLLLHDIVRLQESEKQEKEGDIF